MNGNRKVWVDALRALAIVFVVFGHQASWWDGFFVVTTPIKMPLFFVISGYLFKFNDISLIKKFTSLLYRLGIPWIILGLGPVAIASFLRCDYIRIWTYLLDMISGKVLWFMPCFFISEILFISNTKIVKGRFWLLVLICIVECVVGYVFSVNNIANYAMINRAMIAQFFMCAGLIIKRFEDSIDKIHYSIYVALFIVGCVLAFIEYHLTGTLVDIHQNRYPIFALDMLIILFECVALSCLFRKWNIGNDVSSMIGRNTLLIFILAPYFAAAVGKVLSLFPIEISNKYVMAIIMTILVIVIGTVISEFFTRFAPWVVGLRNKKT